MEGIETHASLLYPGREVAVAFVRRRQIAPQRLVRDAQRARVREGVVSLRSSSARSLSMEQ